MAAKLTTLARASLIALLVSLVVFEIIVMSPRPYCEMPLVDDRQPQTMSHDSTNHHRSALDHSNREALSRWRHVQREPLLTANRLGAHYPEFFLFSVVQFDDDVAGDPQHALPRTRY